MSLSRHDGERLFLYPAIAVSILAYFFIRANVPICLEPAAVQDDGLFFSHAYSILNGDWLGPYSQFTLVKGPGYALFLAFISLFRFPETLAVATLNCASIGIVSYMTQRVFRSSFLAFVVFESLLWNFGPDTLRAIRETIYTPECLVTFACLVLALFVAKERRFYCAALSGLALGWFWITREEGLVILPTIAILGAAAFHKTIKKGGSVRPITKTFVALVSLAVLVVASIATTNLITYGVFRVVDIKGNFQKALEALESVKPYKYVQFVAVPESTRGKVYRISPRFAQLKRFLDEHSAVQDWKQVGCPVYPSSCGDYAGGWFMWALRDAVADDGQYLDAQAASTFYHQLAQDIEKACRAGTVTCEGRVIPFMPRVNKAQLARIPSSVQSVIRRFAFADPPWRDTPPSFGSDRLIRGTAYFLNVANYSPPPALTEPFTALPATTFAVQTRKQIIDLYAGFLPALLLIGMLSFVALAMRVIYKRSYSIEFAVLFAAWIAVAVRVAVLVLIDISSFPAILNQYLSYAFPLLYYVCICSIFLVCRSLATLPNDHVSDPETS